MTKHQQTLQDVAQMLVFAHFGLVNNADRASRYEYGRGLLEGQRYAARFILKHAPDKKAVRHAVRFWLEVRRKPTSLAA